VRIAAEDARLGTPEPRTNRGLPGIAVNRLARLMPMGEALKLMMSSQPMSARRAYEVGLVQELAPDLDGAVAAAERFADQMAECNPSSVRMIKKVAKFAYLMEVDAGERFHAAQDRPHPVDRARGAAFLASRSANGG
jgi:enoyl-CoA hydratase/carnithine racemase